MKVSRSKFEQILKLGYSLDIIWILLEVERGEQLSELSLLSPKIDNLCSSIIRKGLVSSDRLTLEGEELLKFFSSKEEKEKLVKKKPKEDNFKLWWDTFPGTDSFKIGSKEFVGTRALKAKKDDCKEKLNKILSEGDYTIEEMIQALDLEVSQKKQNSLKTGQNKLSFMTNSLSYLNGRLFEPFIELVRAGHKVKTENKEYDGINI